MVVEPGVERLSLKISQVSLPLNLEVVDWTLGVQSDQAKLAVAKRGESDGYVDATLCQALSKAPKDKLHPPLVFGGERSYLVIGPFHLQLLPAQKAKKLEGVIGRTDAALVVVEAIVLGQDIPPMRHESSSGRGHEAREHDRVHEGVSDVVVGASTQALFEEGPRGLEDEGGLEAGVEDWILEGHVPLIQDGFHVLQRGVPRELPLHLPNARAEPLRVVVVEVPREEVEWRLAGRAVIQQGIADPTSVSRQSRPSYLGARVGANDRLSSMCVVTEVVLWLEPVGTTAVLANVGLVSHFPVLDPILARLVQMLHQSIDQLVPLPIISRVDHFLVDLRVEDSGLEAKAQDRFRARGEDAFDGTVQGLELVAAVIRIEIEVFLKEQAKGLRPEES